MRNGYQHNMPSRDELIELYQNLLEEILETRYLRQIEEDPIQSELLEQRAKTLMELLKTVAMFIGTSTNSAEQ